jgi:cytoskeletal protein CcmA (bactofilin family)
MFSKSKEPEPVMTPQAPAAAPPTPKRPAARNGGVPSIISGDLIVKGTLVSNGDVQIDGKVEGDIRSNALVIGEKAIILGDVFAEEAVVRGRVEGSIRARKVQLCATCHVEGNILHEALSVEAGAFFEGNCRHSDNPLADAPDGTISSDRRAAQASHQSRPAPAAPAPAPAKTGGDDGHRPAANFAPLKN